MFTTHIRIQISLMKIIHYSQNIDCQKLIFITFTLTFSFIHDSHLYKSMTNTVNLSLCIPAVS